VISSRCRCKNSPPAFFSLLPPSLQKPETESKHPPFLPGGLFGFGLPPRKIFCCIPTSTPGSSISKGHVHGPFSKAMRPYLWIFRIGQGIHLLLVFACSDFALVNVIANRDLWGPPLSARWVFVDRNFSPSPENPKAPRLPRIVFVRVPVFPDERVDSFLHSLLFSSTLCFLVLIFRFDTIVICCSGNLLLKRGRFILEAMFFGFCRGRAVFLPYIPKTPGS